MIDPKTRQMLHKKQGVHFVGKGFKWVRGRKTLEPSIVCGVEHKLPKDAVPSGEMIPESVDGIRTDVRQHRRVRAWASIPPLEIQVHPREFVQRERPFRIGRSIGHFSITAGTCGAFVQRPTDQGVERLILSNNHVMAASNSGIMGDPILQPGPYDGGQNPTDRVAVLTEFVPIKFAGEGISQCPISSAIVAFLNSLAKGVGSSNYFRAFADDPILPVNYVDAALASLTDPGFADLEGNPVALSNAPLGAFIYKDGRTTEHTEGMVDLVELSLQVGYDQTRTKIAYFEDQQASESLQSGPGDSGSAILSDIDGNKTFVGLLFAGSDTMTVFNVASRVSEAFHGGLFDKLFV